MKRHKILFDTYDNVLFFLILFIQFFLICHGKTLGSFFFSTGTTVLSPNYNNFYHWSLISIIPLILTTLKVITKTRRRLIILLGLIIIVSVPLLLQIGIPYKSIIIYSISIYVVCIAILTIIVNREFNTFLHEDFLKYLLDKVTKLLGLTLVIYGVGVAALKYVSENFGEEPTQFISSFAYPTLIMILSFVLVGYWVILPCWERLIDNNHGKNIP